VPFCFPSPLSLPLFKFKLELTPSSLHSQRTHTHTRAPHSPSPPPLHLTVAGRDVVGEVLLGLYLFFLRHDYIPHASLIVQKDRHRIVQRLGLLFPPAGAPPEPPPTLISAVVALSSPMDIFEASLCGEQDSPAVFTFPCAQHRTPKLAGEAGPPPSGAGHRGCPSFPPDPLGMFARFPSTRSTHPRSFWPPGTPSRARAGEVPPRAAIPSLSRRAHRRAPHARVLDRWIDDPRRPSSQGGYPFGVVHHGPMHRVHGAAHRRLAAHAHVLSRRI
jgi:hypothetical protein